MAVSRQRIGKHAYNNNGIVENVVFCCVRPRLYNEDPSPAGRIIERELRVGSRELNSAREAEKRWRYS
jgi:hypothetical protein